MTRLALLSLIVATAVTALPVSVAHGAGGQHYVSPKQRAEAKRLFNQGHLAYRRGDYEEAILKWQQSYELSNEALIFESIANAYERLGDAKNALEYLRKWREHAPWREHRSLDARIERLDERVKKDEEERRRKAQEEAEQKRIEEEKRRKQEEAERRKREQLRQAQAGPSKREVLGWSLTGAGGALVVAGIIMDAVAASTRPDEASACLQQGDQLLCRDGARADIERSNTLAIAGDVSWIVGGAAVVSGVVVLLTAGGEKGGADAPADLAKPEGEASLVPMVGPDGGGLLLRARF